MHEGHATEIQENWGHDSGLYGNSFNTLTFRVEPCIGIPHTLAANDDSHAVVPHLPRKRQKGLGEPRAC